MPASRGEHGQSGQWCALGVVKCLGSTNRAEYSAFKTDAGLSHDTGTTANARRHVDRSELLGIASTAIQRLSPTVGCLWHLSEVLWDLSSPLGESARSRRLGTQMVRALGEILRDWVEHG